MPPVNMQQVNNRTMLTFPVMRLRRLSYMGSGQIVGNVIIDLQKAFDTYVRVSTMSGMSGKSGIVRNCY